MTQLLAQLIDRLVKWKTLWNKSKLAVFISLLFFLEQTFEPAYHASPYFYTGFGTLHKREGIDGSYAWPFFQRGAQEREKRIKTKSNETRWMYRKYLFFHPIHKDPNVSTSNRSHTRWEIRLWNPRKEKKVSENCWKWEGKKRELSVWNQNEEGKKTSLECVCCVVYSNRWKCCSLFLTHRPTLLCI